MLAVGVAKRELHPFVVELALDPEPFFHHAAFGQRRGEQAERLGGFANQLRHAGRHQCCG